METSLSLIDEALDQVYDPCSLTTNCPLSIREMGLVRNRRCDANGHVYVTLCVTGPSCMMIASLVKGVEECVGSLKGVTGVSVDIDASYFWTPSDMTISGQEKLEEVRRASRASLPLVPLSRRAM